MRNPFKKDPDPFAASRYSGIFRSVRERKRKHMRHWWQWVLLGSLVLVLLVAAVLFLKLKAAEDQMHAGGPGELPQVEEGKPFNALLVGSDSREGLTEEEQLDLGAKAVGGERADTIILAHIDPNTNRVTMVQFPRDLWVPVNGVDNKINAALEKGPRNLVKTIEDLTGITINRYAQVNIAGFRDVIDAIGGVEVCIAEPIPFDSQTGLEITPDEVGMVKFDGDRALRFVRSRAFTTGDFERIQNQQKFLAAAIDKALSLGNLFRPDRIHRLLDVAGDNLSTDQDQSINGLRHLGNRFRSFDPEHYEAYIAPNLGTANLDGVSVVLQNEPAMKLMFEAVRNNESPAEYDGVPNVDPTTVKVGVYNGTFEEGKASAAADALRTATDLGSGPVEVVGIADAGRRNYTETVIRYESDTKSMAELIAAAIPGAELEEGNVKGEAYVDVIVGKRFKTKTLVQILALPIPRPTALPAECRA